MAHPHENGPAGGTPPAGPAASAERGGVAAWYGLPYATLGPGAGPLDRATPVPLTPRGAERLEDVPVFPQLPSRLEALMGPAVGAHPRSHDAFRLNVWAPRDAAGLPVLVFVHGGAWATGGGAVRWYRGEALACAGTVVVTVNYRLGPAGHLADEGGDAFAEVGGHRPLHDLLLALRWVQAHIAAFGGDPDRVTVAGQSAGAWYAWVLAILPTARGLLRRAALWSLPEIAPWTPLHRAAFTASALDRAGLAPDDLDDPGVVGGRALLEACGAELADAPRVPGAMPPMYLPALRGPVARAASAPEIAARTLHVEALQVDDTAHEMTPFIPRELRTATLGALVRRRIAGHAGGAHVSRVPGAPSGPADATPAERRLVHDVSWLAFGRIADRVAAAARTAWPDSVAVDRATFTAESPMPGVGAGHCVDLPFRFGNADDWHDAPMIAGLDRADLERAADSLRKRTVAFVRGADWEPDGDDAVLRRGASTAAREAPEGAGE